jgi:hypothetical protein
MLAAACVFAAVALAVVVPASLLLFELLACSLPPVSLPQLHWL